MKKFQVLMIDARHPELEERFTDPDSEREYISSMGGHGNYMLDIKGPMSRISSQINMILGNINDPSILQPKLAEQLLNCFSSRHYALREHFQQFLDEWMGAEIYSYYSVVQEFRAGEDFNHAEPADVATLSPRTN